MAWVFSLDHILLSDDGSVRGDGKQDLSLVADDGDAHSRVQAWSDFRSEVAVHNTRGLADFAADIGLSERRNGQLNQEIAILGLSTENRTVFADFFVGTERLARLYRLAEIYLTARAKPFFGLGSNFKHFRADDVDRFDEFGASIAELTSGHPLCVREFSATLTSGFDA